MHTTTSALPRTRARVAGDRIGRQSERYHRLSHLVDCTAQIARRVSQWVPPFRWKNTFFLKKVKITCSGFGTYVCHIKRDSGSE